ncbi:MAG: YihY/virulence factor BrkB family protein [Verrucomicrobiota bacterium]|nr:YihY/virulence factor BrkB family protein [Verrucomicrobiota bacterium]
MDIKNIGAKLVRARRFVVSDVWDVDLSLLPLWRRLGAKTVRIIHLTLCGFWDDDCSLHAASLTFNTLMAIVPIMALSLALIRGIGTEDAVKNKVRASVEKGARSLVAGAVVKLEPRPAAGKNGQAAVPQEPPMTPEIFAGQIVQLVDQGFSKMDRVNFAALGGLGLALLIYTALAVFSSVELSFNRVWGVTVGRSWWRKFTDYLSLLFVLPILIVGTTSIPVMDMAAKILNKAATEAIRSSLATGMVKSLMVYAMTSMTCAFLIMFMPNTRVGLRSGIAGGMVAGVLFIWWLKICAAIQYGVAGYGAVYGGFAAVPILLAWVFVSWHVILFGAELAYAAQNCETHRMEQGTGKASMQSRIRLALAVVLDAARAMAGQSQVFETSRFAAKKVVPARFLNDVVEELVRDGLLARISEEKGSQYVLLKAPETLLVSEVIESCLRSGVRPEVFGLGKLGAEVEKAVTDATGGVRASLKDLTVKDLLAEGQGAAPNRH